MPDKPVTPHTRALALSHIKTQLSCLYWEDLLALQAAIAAAMSGACAAPAEERLTTAGEWLEERRFIARNGATHHYVYRRWLDDTDHERGHIIFYGTLADYQTAKRGK